MAIVLYRLVKYGKEAIKFSAEKYENLYMARKLANLKRQAERLGLCLVQASR